jgi:hypothetical protein
MYIPWSMPDAIDKMKILMKEPHRNQGLISDWNNGTIDRTIDILEGKGCDWSRSDMRYRDYVAGSKYELNKPK